jgi:glyoxylase-like metal-dependent hydrolase (beta-lactamase superfamily II)
MRLQSLSRGTAFGALAVSVGFGGLVPVALAAPGTAAPAEARAGQGARLPAALRLAVRAVGGAQDLRGLRSFRIENSGRRWILDEGVRPGGPAEPSATFESRVRYVLGTDRAPARIRVDAVRTSLGLDRPVHEVLSARRGYIRGVDANFSTPALKAMPSDRWAAIRTEQRLLNPHVLLRRALRHPQLAHNGGRQRLDGRAYRVLVLRDDVAPIRLFVDARTGRLARLRTLQHDYLRRDVRIEVFYRRWAPAGDGLRFPRTVSLWSDGQRLHQETRPRAGVVANPTIRPRVFAFPADLGPAPFRAGLARIGERTSEWVMSFANLGFIKDGGQTAINPTTVTDGTAPVPGITLLGGVANNSLVVQRDGGVVVFEGALHDHRAEAVIRFIRRSPDFTGPITHVVTTHHHSDHAGGMRPYVALGATAVVGRQAVPFFRRVFADRGSTILPDRLDRRPDAVARVRGVPAGGLTLGGVQSEIDVFPIETGHAVDMVVPYVRDQGVLFTSDIYSPPAPPDPADADAQAIAALVEAQGLSPEWIVGGHGTFIAYADFAAALGTP